LVAPAEAVKVKVIVVLPPPPAVTCVIVQTYPSAVAVNLELAFKHVAKLVAAAILFDPEVGVPASNVGESVSVVVVVVPSVAVITVPSVVII
jgi:hypothetical protein